jgi:peroxiredoxin Q/BCP
MARQLAPGDAAPDFSVRLAGGGETALSDCAERTLVLYFYPKADTTGCTREAQAFSALAGAFKKAGAAVLGLSADPVKALDKFTQKYALDVALGSDEAHAVLQPYGVWVEKSMYGRKYMGIERTTFLIGPDGRIVEVWRKVKVPGHAEAVLAAVHAIEG